MGTTPTRAIAAACLLPVACITVNINFPVKEIEDAAEVIVDEARAEGNPEPAEPAPPDPLKTEAPSPSGSAPAPAPPRFALHFLAQEAEGEGEGKAKGKDASEEDLELEIDTPVIKLIRASLTKRFKKLLPFYEKGAIGENREGYLEVREEEKLSLSEKRDVKALLEEENRDRKNLYLEIVKQNRFPEERLKDVARIFARKWIEKSRTGWWIQDLKGAWERKPPPKKEPKKTDSALN